MQRIQAGVQTQGFVHFAISLDRFGQVESSQPDSSVLQQVLLDFILILGKIFGTHGIVSIGSSHFKRAVRHTGSFALGFLNVDTEENKRNKK